MVRRLRQFLRPRGGARALLAICTADAEAGRGQEPQRRREDQSSRQPVRGGVGAVIVVVYPRQCAAERLLLEFGFAVLHEVAIEGVQHAQRLEDHGRQRPGIRQRVGAPVAVEELRRGVAGRVDGPRTHALSDVVAVDEPHFGRVAVFRHEHVLRRRVAVGEAPLMERAEEGGGLREDAETPLQASGVAVPLGEVGGAGPRRHGQRLERRHPGHELHHITDVGLEECAQRTGHVQSVERQPPNPRDSLPDALSLGRVPRSRQLHRQVAPTNGIDLALAAVAEKPVELVLRAIGVDDDVLRVGAHGSSPETWTTAIVLSSMWFGVGHSRNARSSTRRLILGSSARTSETSQSTNSPR